MVIRIRSLISEWLSNRAKEAHFVICVRSSLSQRLLKLVNAALRIRCTPSLRIVMWIRSLLFGFCLLVQANAFSSQAGVTLSTPLATKDPSDLYGYKASVWYQPASFEWGNAHLLWDASFGHWWVDDSAVNRELNIVAVAPMLRYFMLSDRYVFKPFVDISIGVAYLSQTRFADRNLGMHFCFQDQLGMGVAFGPQHRIFTSLYAVHYSNGSLSSMNAGITIPIMLNVGYQF